MSQEDLFHHPQEQDYWKETVEIETDTGDIFTIKTFILRVYPTTFNGYDAYMDMPKNTNHAPHTFNKICSSRLNRCWKVIAHQESPIDGYFRGDYTSNNPRAWIFGLKVWSN